jgi:hypothetical protein
MKHSELKRTASLNQRSPVMKDRASSFTKPESNGCFLARFSATPCSGRLVRCHLVPKQMLKREKLDPWDQRTWVWGLRRHRRKFRAPRGT